MRVKSKQWYLRHFPQYIDEKNRPYKLKTGSGRISGTMSDHILNPYDFAPGGFGELNIYGYIPQRYTDKPDWWPWVKKLYVPQEIYFDFLASLNWFANGGKTMNGKDPGLNPRELIGGKREVGQDEFICPRGIYFPRSLRYGKPARFQWTKGPKRGEEWIGDAVIEYIPTHTN